MAAFLILSRVLLFSLLVCMHEHYKILSQKQSLSLKTMLKNTMHFLLFHNAIINSPFDRIIVSLSVFRDFFHNFQLQKERNSLEDLNENGKCTSLCQNAVP